MQICEHGFYAVYDNHQADDNCRIKTASNQSS